MGGEDVGMQCVPLTPIQLDCDGSQARVHPRSLTTEVVVIITNGQTHACFVVTTYISIPCSLSDCLACNKAKA